MRGFLFERGSKESLFKHLVTFMFFSPGLLILKCLGLIQQIEHKIDFRKEVRNEKWMKLNQLLRSYIFISKASSNTFLHLSLRLDDLSLSITKPNIYFLLDFLLKESQTCNIPADLDFSCSLVKIFCFSTTKKCNKKYKMNN